MSRLRPSSYSVISADISRHGVMYSRLAAPCCLLYRPQLIAACCFAIACVMLRQALPEKPLSVSEQRTLWEHDREEGEEETEESAFQAEHYWLEWLEVGSDELRGETIETSSCPFLARQRRRLIKADPSRLSMQNRSCSSSTTGDFLKILSWLKNRTECVELSSDGDLQGCLSDGAHVCRYDQKC